MESRKRHLTDEEDPTITKKRVLTGSNGSPHVNGIVSEQEEPSEGDNLELFRKEAIFRRMRHYSREHERSESRIAELERRKNTCEAGLAAMSACWTQLVETIRLLVKPEDLPHVDVNTQDIFDLTTHAQGDHAPDFAGALGGNMNATHTLVSKFVELGRDSQSNLRQGDSFNECQKVTTECIALRSQLDIMHARLQDSESRKAEYHEALVATENRLDRLRSGTVLAMQSRAGADKQQLKDETMEESQRKPPSPAQPKSPPQDNGTYDPSESEILQEHLKSREAKIAELEREAAVLRDEKTILELELRSLSYEKMAENPHYKILLEHSSALEATVAETRGHVARLSDELGALRTSRKDWEEGIIIAAGQVNQELKAMLAKRDVENARLRDQREQQAAELNERKHKDSIKLASLQELKALSDSRSERILVLESELCRHKAQLAANASNEDLMMFFADGNIENAAYIENLKSRVTTAENRAAALEQTLSIFQDDHPNVVEHMKAEADALQKLSEVVAQLDIYKTIYGDPSTLPPDVSRLAEQLRQKEAEAQKLRLLDTQRGQAETSLYAELDKLSAAWEALDRQVKNKVFDLTGLEDRLTKSGLDRAKSENKFYAAMRDKEAIETERKNLARNIEKQAKLVERLVDTERNLTSQVSALEKELVALRKASDAYKEKLDDLEGDVDEWQVRAEGEKHRTAELRSIMLDREKTVELKRAELRRLEDGLTRSKKEVEHQMLKMKEVPATGQQRDSEADGLLKILKCSTCRLNFRNTIITKCMHTFCKQCVEARISTRQRKCPACNLAFSQSDVQSLYFQ